MNLSKSKEDSWFAIRNANEIASPALLIYPYRVEENIRRMIAIAGSPDRLRPHVKTHKMAEIVKLQMKHGIHKFKCATIAEAEMVANCGVRDILLAMQPVGPNIQRFFSLKKKFPAAQISAIIDSAVILNEISKAAVENGMEACLWLDINSGMNRTGVAPGEDSIRLYQLMYTLPRLKVGGLHAYDGNIHEHDLSARKLACDSQFEPVNDMIRQLTALGLPVPAVVVGGTPAFPIHARRQEVELSPGTLLLWDYGYSSAYADLDFLHAALLLTRVVSKPRKNLLCLDLGTKAIASEMPQPRVQLLGLDNYRIIAHNEEHLVIETPEADSYQTGDAFFGLPMHICPTVARYESVSIIEEGTCIGEWQVTARNRKITI